MNLDYKPKSDYELIHTDDSPEVMRLKMRINDLVLQIKFDASLQEESPTLNDAWEQYRSLRKIIGVKKTMKL